ncbi:MAG: hypothetical protein KDG56_12035, partial [Ottowia sp.]|nr:hypothetical protein [Ottowia sp.]
WLKFQRECVPKWPSFGNESTTPNRVVRIIVPFAAGGPADNYARYVAQKLGDAFNQPFIVEDKPGAGSVIGTDAAAKAAPDGHPFHEGAG